MAKDYFSSRCQNCGGRLHLTRLVCDDCGLTLEGRQELPRLARLSPEDREFIELFILSAGSLKEVGKILDLSYPTVRNRLDRVIENLKALDYERQQERLSIIQQLERGEISSEDAARKLSQLA